MERRPLACSARWVLRVGQALLWVAVFVGSAALGLLLHADLPPLRSALVAAVNGALDGSLRGRIDIVSVDHLGASSATARRIDVIDEQGRVVLTLEGVKLRYRPWLLLEALLSSDGEPLILDHVRVDRSKVLLIRDEASGEWTLARALSKKTAAPGGRRAKQPLVYSLQAIELGEAHIVIQHPALGTLQADIHRLQGSADLGGNDTDVEVERFGVQLVQGGGLALKGTGSLRLLRNGFIAGAFHGFVDEVEVDAAAQFEAGELSARLDLPLASPEQVRRVLPDWPLRAALTAHVTARGPLDTLALAGELRAEQSSIGLAGNLDLKRFPTSELSLSVRALDARLLWPNAPATSLEASATVRVSGTSSTSLIRIDAETEPATIAGTQLPRSQLSLTREDGLTRANLRISDARAQLEADALFLPGGAIELSAHARQVVLHAWPELKGLARGQSEIEARARIADGRLSGNLVARSNALSSGSVSLGRSRIEATFTGALQELPATQLEASLDSSDVQLGPLKLASAHLQGRGRWHDSRWQAELRSSAGARVTAAARLDLDPVVAVTGLDVSWTEPAFSLSARADTWSPDTGTLVLSSFRLSGSVGNLSGSAHIAGQRVRLRADAERLDTRLLSRSFGVTDLALSGRLTGHGELSVEPGATRGALTIEARQLGIKELAISNARVEATLDGVRLEARVDALDPALGRFEARAKAELAGPVLDAAAWRGATGSASAQLEHLPLWPVGLLLARNTRVQDFDGRLDVALQVERGAPDVAPSLFIQANTRELTFAMAPGDGSTEPPLPFERFALHGSASLDGPSRQGAATVLLTDERGALVTTTGALELDLAALLAEPGAILQKLLETPLDALLRLHPRPVSLLPPPLGLPELGGTLEGTLQLRGSLREPSLTLAVQARQLSGGFADGRRAVDVSGVGYYTPNSGRLSAHAEVIHAGKRLVAARLEGEIPSPMAPPTRPREVELRAAAMVNGLPLELWPAAAREQLEARLYGSFDIEKHGATLRQRAQLEIADLSVAGHVLGNGRLSFESHPSATRAELRIGSPSRYVALSLRGVEPASTDASLAIEGTLVARQFAAASLAPLTSGVLTRLGGEMDADLDFTLRPADGYLGINGQATLTRGSANLDLLGLEVHDLAAVVKARSTPEYTVLLIDPVNARARARNSSLQGNAELWLQGFRVVDGEATLALNGVPLSLNGSLRGVARGQVKGRLERLSDHMRLEVAIPELRINLPTSSARSLIALEPNPDLNVLQIADQKPARPQGALLWKIDFELGDAVRVQRADLDVPLTGEPRLEYQHEVRPSGSIEALPGGRLTLFDQTFTIDRGLVQFVPEAPDNPRVDLTASWRAPDGTTIYVDITGSAKDATVLTRDDRGLQEVERFYLITGTPGGTGRSVTTTGAADGGGGDEAALGQTFAFGINELLRESLGNVAVSVGTTPDDRASYSASVRLSDKLSFQGNFQPASDSNLEESANDLTGTLDYRFSRHWSLRTELGTSGGAFDLLWSYRY